MNPDFKWFVHELTQAGHDVKVRTNLTVLVEHVTEETPKFLKDHRVKLVASMPCYLEENVNSQRGSGVFEKSIAALKLLNALGYGHEPDLTLDLVYNPGGLFLPPSQQSLEADYRRELANRFDIVFNKLITITNMPIGRFFSELVQEQKDNEYMNLLQQSFNPLTLDALMCRRQISIGWDGTLYDCDFNLSLGLTVNHNTPAHVREFDVKVLTKRKIVTGDHCFSCTAGSGSSCTGSLI
jgi:radical SAM/Cys-rich protein